MKKAFATITATVLVSAVIALNVYNYNGYTQFVKQLDSSIWLTHAVLSSYIEENMLKELSSYEPELCNNLEYELVGIANSQRSYDNILDEIGSAYGRHGMFNEFTAKLQKYNNDWQSIEALLLNAKNELNYNNWRLIKNNVFEHLLK